MIRTFDEEKLKLRFTIQNYKDEREHLLKEYSRIVNNYKEREKELISRIKEYENIQGKYLEEKLPLTKYSSLSLSIDKFHNVNGNLSTKHSKTKDYNRSVTSESIS